ncbi:PASTA domain-containing protein [Peptococcus simiae]|uniref:PASTA domain-containing protein n=1 Tax=Peptococcus simiae TaxID=1643805 RepID=A0ABW9GVM2_9FIRM
MIPKLLVNAGKLGLKMAVSHLPEVKQVADETRKHVKTHLDETVKVPDLVRKGFPLTLEEAERLLTNVGLEILPVPLKPVEAAVAYADDFAGQVVAVNPKPGKRVAKGTLVVVRYLPEEVLLASQDLAAAKARDKADRKAARAQRIAQRKDRLADLMADGKSKAGGVTTKAKEGLDQVLRKDKEGQ